MRNSKAGLLACIQAALQPLLFPRKERQTVVKRRERANITNCNVHRKKGGAHKWVTPGPSATGFYLETGAGTNTVLSKH